MTSSHIRTLRKRVCCNGLTTPSIWSRNCGPCNSPSEVRSCCFPIGCTFLSSRTSQGHGLRSHVLPHPALTSQQEIRPNEKDSPPSTYRALPMRWRSEMPITFDVLRTTFCRSNSRYTVGTRIMRARQAGIDAHDGRCF